MTKDQVKKSTSPVVGDWWINENQLVEFYEHLRTQFKLGNGFIIAEIIRRLLDRWAIGDDPDPWLPLPSGFWDSPSLNLVRIGSYRLRWASDDPFFKHTHTCGAYGYILNCNGWITGTTGYYVCIGCNSFYGKPGNGLSALSESNLKSPSMAFPPAGKRKNPKPEDVIKLMEILGMKKHLMDILETKPESQSDKTDEG